VGLDALSVDCWVSATQRPTPLRVPTLGFVYTHVLDEVGTHGGRFACGSKANRAVVTTPSLVHWTSDALLPAEVSCLGLAGEAASSTRDDRLWQEQVCPALGCMLGGVRARNKLWNATIIRPCRFLVSGVG
jgi:hypothetical protein